jgi:tetratricopeptide (TPR) repeat protein
MRERPVLTAIVLGGLLAAAGVTGYFAYQQHQTRQHWDEAQRLIADYEFRHARTHLEECAKVWKHSGETMFLLARTCRRAGDLKAAQRYLKEAERLQWSEKELAFEFELIRFQDEGATPADGSFVDRYLEKRSPEEVLVLEALATGLFRKNQHGITASLLNHWVEHYPLDWQPRHWRGSFSLESGNTNQAQADLEKALELNPRHDESRRLLVLALLKNGNPSRAFPLVQEYLEKYPDRPEMLAALARCQRAARRTEAARTTLKDLLDKNTTYGSAMLILAQLEADEDNPRAALHWLRELDRVMLNDNEELNTAAALKVNVLRRLGLDQEAEAAEKRLQQLKEDLAEYNSVMTELNKRPPTVEDRFKLGELALRMGVEQQGLHWLDGIARELPEHKAKAQRMMLAFYEKRDDPVARERAKLLRQALGITQP